MSKSQPEQAKQELKRIGELTISRVSCGDGSDYIGIEIRDGKDRTRIAIDPKDFAVAITGRACVPAILKSKPSLQEDFKREFEIMTHNFLTEKERVRKLVEYLQRRKRTIEASIASEVLAGNVVRENIERTALIEVQSVEIFLEELSLSLPAPRQDDRVERWKEAMRSILSAIKSNIDHLNGSKITDPWISGSVESQKSIYDLIHDTLQSLSLEFELGEIEELFPDLNSKE